MKRLSDLVALGAPPLAVASPWPPKFKCVQFNGNRYYPNPIGEEAVIFPILDSGLIDEVAWIPTTGRVATLLGLGCALGQGQLGRDGLGTHGRPLPVRRNPLEWLKAHRTGIVIVDWDLAARVLGGMILEAADDRHARELERRLALRPPSIVVARARLPA